MMYENILLYLGLHILQGDSVATSILFYRHLGLTSHNVLGYGNFGRQSKNWVSYPSLFPWLRACYFMDEKHKWVWAYWLYTLSH